MDGREEVRKTPHRSFWRQPNGIVLLAFVALVVLGGILNACGEPTEETAASPTQEPSVAATETASEPTETVEAQERVAVPLVVGKRVENAKDAMRKADLKASVVRKYSPKPSGTVLLQSVSVGTEVRPSRTIRLVVSKGPKPQPSPPPNCTAGYSPCLVYHGGADYDCSAGEGNGPYLTEPGVVYTVSGSDPYDLDADGDGSGCE
jgi:PASTA domain